MCRSFCTPRPAPCSIGTTNRDCLRALDAEADVSRDVHGGTFEVRENLQERAVVITETPGFGLRDMDLLFGRAGPISFVINPDTFLVEPTLSRAQTSEPTQQSLCSRMEKGV